MPGAGGGGGGGGDPLFSDSFGPGASTDFAEQDAPLAVNSTAHVLTAEFPGSGSPLYDQWSSIPQFADGYRLRAHFKGLNAGVPNWNNVGVIANLSAWNQGLCFVAYWDGSYGWSENPSIPFDVGTHLTPWVPGSFDASGADLWLEIWRVSNTAHGAVYTHDPALGGSADVSSTYDVTGNPLFEAGVADYFGFGGYSWTVNTVGLAEIQVFAV